MGRGRKALPILHLDLTRGSLSPGSTNRGIGEFAAVKDAGLEAGGIAAGGVMAGRRACRDVCCSPRRRGGGACRLSASLVDEGDLVGKMDLLSPFAWRRDVLKGGAVLSFSPDGPLDEHSPQGGGVGWFVGAVTITAQELGEHLLQDVRGTVAGLYQLSMGGRVVGYCLPLGDYSSEVLPVATEADGNASTHVPRDDLLVSLIIGLAVGLWEDGKPRVHWSRNIVALTENDSFNHRD